MPRIRRTFALKSRESDDQTFENNFRYPPKPESYYDVKEKGVCRWCDSIINNERGERNMRASWHPRCSEEFLMSIIQNILESISDKEIIVNVPTVENTTQGFR